MRSGPLKPEYLLRPRQLVRRLGRALGPPRDRWQVVALPFGLPLEVDVEDAIGKAVWHLGIYELLVSELLFRLAAPGELVADVGAHVGHMSAVLAARVGPRGKVVAFEPNPALRERLNRSAQRWRPLEVEVRAEAVAAQRGTARFSVPEGDNTGLGRIGGAEGLEVPTTTLDEVFAGRPPALIKLDVEGGELAALTGARRILGSVRDVVFEDHQPQPSAVTRALEAAGFQVLRFRKGWLGPRPTALDQVTSAWEPPVFVATREPARLAAALASLGWQVLRRR